MKKRNIACHDCDLLMTIPALKHRQEASCPRCGYVLTRFYQHAQPKLLVSALSALIFLTFSLKFPFILFSLNGNEHTLTLLESIQTYDSLSYLFISALLIFTALVIPLCFLLCVVYITWSFKSSTLFPRTGLILKLTLLLKPWNMAEIFLLGIIISFIKLQSMAYIAFGPSFIFYLLFITCLMSTFVYFDRYQMWSLYQFKVRRLKQRAQHVNS
jgi:paraquat-inducible protein A